MNPKIFPTVLILLELSAAVVAGFAGDFRWVIYWVAAAALTATVTY